MSEDKPIRKKTHMRRRLIVMPRYGSKTIVEMIDAISLPHITVLDGPFVQEGQAA